MENFSPRVSDFGAPGRQGPNMSNDELLRRYLREDSQAAFAMLVSRHVDLVYSAALRQVRQPHLAEEVAQAVFVDLARQARTLPDDQPVSAWLYVVTRRTAIDVVRREVRRRAGRRRARHHENRIHRLDRNRRGPRRDHGHPRSRGS